jgi:hypothetical protein
VNQKKLCILQICRHNCWPCKKYNVTFGMSRETEKKNYTVQIGFRLECKTYHMNSQRFKLSLLGQLSLTTDVEAVFETSHFQFMFEQLVARENCMTFNHQRKNKFINFIQHAI